MKQIHFALLLLGLLVLCTPMIAQKSKPENPEKAIKTAINRFFEGLENGDTTMLKSTCMPNMILQTYMEDKTGKMQVYTQELADFVAMIAVPSADRYNEKIRFEAVHAEQSLASVWTPYRFYINGKRSHCGTNSFQMVKTEAGWKIQYIIDTRRKQGCNG